LLDIQARQIDNAKDMVLLMISFRQRHEITNYEAEIDLAQDAVHRYVSDEQVEEQLDEWLDEENAAAEIGAG
jgi:hypothetical protein